MLQNWRETEVTIAAGESASGEVVSGNFIPWGIYVPGEWTAADIGFSGWVEGTTYAPIKTQAGAVVKITTVATAEAGFYQVPWESPLSAVKAFKILSLDTGDGSAENQVAERVLKVIWKQAHV